MQTKPDLSDETILARIRDGFKLAAAKVTFLPLGYENSAIYRITGEDGTAYFLKLIKFNFNEISVSVPAYLHSRGIAQVLAPMETSHHTLWVKKCEFIWSLYPFFEGKTGFERALSKTQWIELGRAMKAIHATRLPAELEEWVPREDYSPGKRELVMSYLEQVKQDDYDDPIAAGFAEILMTKQDEIRCMVERAEKLAQVLLKRSLEPVFCHSDLHGRNILVNTQGELVIIDWDTPILAPKERDLMFIGGGVGGIWNNDQEVEWFYEGYGRTEIDAVALSYYRYERIITDIADFSGQVFSLWGSVEDRQKCLRLNEQFGPNNVVEIAHKTYGTHFGKAIR